MVCCSCCHKLVHINKNPECGFQSPASSGELSERVSELTRHFSYVGVKRWEVKLVYFSCSSSDVTSSEMYREGAHWVQFFKKLMLLWQLSIIEITILAPYHGKIFIPKTFTISLGKIILNHKPPDSKSSLGAFWHVYEAETVPFMWR